MRELLSRTRMVKDVVFAARSSANTCDNNYKEVIRIINSLQSNFKCIEENRHNRRAVELKNISESQKYLERCGVTLDKLDGLSVIHIAGTKGKGSTSAFCESILRHHGYRTGFFSSPHLISVRERIRIDGRPLGKVDFSAYVRYVYGRLWERRVNDDDMPSFFKFLSTVAFHVFLEEKVDVAIVEVGIGGEYDCTNVLRKVSTVGITSLGLDHTNILGNTIQEIAWQKAGIMKPGSMAFTTNEQPTEAMTVLQSRSIERQCPLVIAPSLNSYDWGQHSPDLGIPSDIQKVNASLALQLSNHWMHNHGKSKNGISKLKEKTSPLFFEIDSTEWNLNGNGAKINTVVVDTISITNAMDDGLTLNGANTDVVKTAEPFTITSAMARGLKYCQWPGRSQTITLGDVNYYLDGAHTLESMQACTDWFRQVQLSNHRPHKRVLLYNTTGDRNSAQFLHTLFLFDFHIVIFCPNNLTCSLTSSSDLINLMVNDKLQLTRCENHRDVWRNLQESARQGDSNCSHLNADVNNVKVFPCVSDAVSYIENLSAPLDVLVTGSLHLVGSVLSLIDPDLTSMTIETSSQQPLLRMNKT